MIIAETNRATINRDKTMRQRSHAYIDWSKQELADIDKDTSQMIKENRAWQAKDKGLQSVPGVGPVSSAALIAELSELGILNRKKIAALAGVVPLIGIAADTEASVVSGEGDAETGNLCLWQLLTQFVSTLPLESFMNALSVTARRRRWLFPLVCISCSPY